MVLEIIVGGMILTFVLLLLKWRRDWTVREKKANEFIKSYEEWRENLSKKPDVLPSEDEIITTEYELSEEENEAEGIESSVIQDEQDAEDEGEE